MWMSSMTCGVKRKLRPRTWVLRPSFFFVVGATAGDFLSFAMMKSFSLRRLEDQLLLGRLEIVVVPELPAGDDLLHLLDAVRRLEVVHPQLAGEPTGIEIGHLAGHGVDAEPLDLAADIDRAVIHRIAEVLAGIAQDDHAAALHHEAAEGAGPA